MFVALPARSGDFHQSNIEFGVWKFDCGRIVFMKRFSLHLATWLAILGAWVIVSRDHHPTLLINIFATSVLVAVSAMAVYVNAIVLWPQFRRHRIIWRYGLELICMVLVLDVIAVVTIQVLYDRLWGPDPLRYGIGINIVYEAIFIGLHLAVATAVLAIIRRRSAKA
jgi:hypothetical protein